MLIKIDDLTGNQIQELLQAHLENMFMLSPPESVHALDLEELRKPEITFWTVWDGDDLLGCGALKNSIQCMARSNRCGQPRHTGAKVSGGLSFNTFLPKPKSGAIHD
jgi:hypothetical protein